MELETTSIQGKFTHTIYRNEQTMFTVSKFRLYELTEKDIIVTGLLPEMPKDLLFNLEGKYVEHPRYGMQFSVESFKKVLPSDTDSLIRYLSGPLFVGVGKKLATTIVEVLGTNCIDLIMEDSTNLDKIPNLKEKKRQAILDGLHNQDDVEESIRFFSTHGLGIRNIMRIDRAYGKDALKLIQENPYRLVEEVDGIGFQTADKLALSMGISMDNPSRLQAACLTTVLELCMANGDSYLQYDTFIEYMERKLSGLTSSIDEIVYALRQRRLLIVEENRLYHHTQYDAEEGIQYFLSTFPKEEVHPVDEKELNEFLPCIQQDIGIEYDQKQIEAIYQFFHEHFMILTGGPGTGKTTVVRGMIALFKKLYPQYTVALCAPTGRAAKRLSELTSTSAYTIHSLLKWDLESNTFGFNSENPVLLDLLIIDEFSMVDPWLFYQLCKAGTMIKKILIIGDEDQLPSVSCGSLLRDIVSSKQYPLVRLDKIFRQQEGSDVITLAHEVKHGECFVLENKLTKDVKFIECSPFEVNSGVLQLVEEALNRGYSIEEIQVLAPKYNGVVGIDRLNHTLQKACNPPETHKRELKVGYKTFREGDKILQLKNQPEDDVYNGDIGILVEINYSNTSGYKTNTITVDFDGIFVDYTLENFQNITHAYCVSIHKSQGSEYPIVIMPIVPEYSFMLQKRLIYTGISRARKSLILIGSKSSFIKGIQTEDRQIRNTTLRQRLMNTI